MHVNLGDRSLRHRQGILSAVSVGFFLLLIGMLFVITPNLADKIVEFFQDIKTVNVTSLNVTLASPADVGKHVAVYSTVMQFSLAWGIFLVAMLVLRFASHSPNRKKAENISDLVFWFGAAYVIQTWLIERQTWFEFWSMILILLGSSLVVRAAYLAATRGRS